METYDLIMDSFDALPSACIVNDKFIAVHGGISPKLKTIEDLQRLDRYKELPREGLFCDIVWSDPASNLNGSL